MRALCLIGQVGAASLAAAAGRGDTLTTLQGRVVGQERANTVESEPSVARRAGRLECARSAARLGDQLPVRARVLLSLQQRAGNRAVRGLVQRLRSANGGLQGRVAPVQHLGLEEQETLQGRSASSQLQQQGGDDELQLLAAPSAPAQRQAEPLPRRNESGLPVGLKSGVESLAGISLDGVEVHYNSAQPARLNALAYAQGTEIHVGPGQERHLPHEAWHVVQQAQGRVKPTMQLQDGMPVNDDEALEHEADAMGARASSLITQSAPAVLHLRGQIGDQAIQRLLSAHAALAPWATPRVGPGPRSPVVQRAVIQRNLLPVARHREIVVDAAKRLKDPDKATDNQWIQAIYQELDGVGNPSADRCVDELVRQRIIDQNDWLVIEKDLKTYRSQQGKDFDLFERHNLPAVHSEYEAEKWVWTLIKNRIGDLYSTVPGFAGHAQQVQQGIDQLVGWYREKRFSDAAYEKYKREIINALETGKSASGLQIPKHFYSFEAGSTVTI